MLEIKPLVVDCPDAVSSQLSAGCGLTRLCSICPLGHFNSTSVTDHLPRWPSLPNSTEIHPTTRPTPVRTSLPRTHTHAHMCITSPQHCRAWTCLDHQRPAPMHRAFIDGLSLISVLCSSTGFTLTASRCPGPLPCEGVRQRPSLHERNPSI